MNDTSFDFRKPDAAPAPAKAKEPISLEGGSAGTTQSVTLDLRVPARGRTRAPAATTDD